MKLLSQTSVTVGWRFVKQEEHTRMYHHGYQQHNFFKQILDKRKKYACFLCEDRGFIIWVWYFKM